MSGHDNRSKGKERFRRRHGKKQETSLRLVREEENTPPEALDRLPLPYVTYALLVFIGLVFVAMAIVSRGHIDAFPPAVTDLFGDKVNQRIVFMKHLQQWWRFVTPIFLHSGILHIAVNAYSLYILGKNMEPFYGSRRYLLVFMVAGIAGNLASFRFSTHPSLGASGAIFGLIGAGIVFPIRFRSLFLAIFPERDRKLILRQLIQIAVFNLLIGFMLRNLHVDNAAHVGGLLGGAFAALFILPDGLDPNPIRPRINRLLWATTGAIVLLVGMSAILQARWAIGPWWRMSIPATWKPVGKISRLGGFWRIDAQTTLDLTTLDLTDPTPQPDLLKEAKGLFARKDLPNPLLLIDGGIGRHFVLRTGETITDLYLIVAYDRMLVIKMQTTPEHYDAVARSFQKTVTALRFLHPPPPDLSVISSKG